MQRGYCAVSTKYSPALIQASALSSPAAFLKARALRACSLATVIYVPACLHVGMATTAGAPHAACALAAFTG